jgi:hypothetical protein
MIHILEEKKLFFITLSFLAAFIVLGASVGFAAEEDEFVKKLEAPLSQSGTIGFKLHTDKMYFNGKGQEDYRQTLLTLPGVNRIFFDRKDEVVNLAWVWQRQDNIHYAGILTDFTRLPGPQSYYLQYTWDSAKGLTQGYLNGRPLRLPGTRNKAWWVSNQADEVIIGSGNLKVTDIVVRDYYTPPEQIIVDIPDEYYGKDANLVGFDNSPEPIEFALRRGKLIYENLLDNEKRVTDWVKEGPVDISFTNGVMQMRSQDFKEHIVFWCPEDFPESFIAEWDFEPLSYNGLAIVFFAAKGEGGEDIFDPSLNTRDGRFVNYIKGDIVSYHVSYFANIEEFQMGRPDSNLRKNNRFYRVGSGPVAIKPGDQGWHQLRIIKDKNRIQLFANGNIYLDWTDDAPDRYGKYHRDGKIGFRQMMPTIGAYRNFRVWELKQLESNKD